MEHEFSTIWKRMKRNEGVVFHTKHGKDFTYTMDDTCLYPSRTDFQLHINNIAKAYGQCPVDGPGSFSPDIMGPSYIWAILHDERITSP